MELHRRPRCLCLAHANRMLSISPQKKTSHTRGLLLPITKPKLNQIFNFTPGNLRIHVVHHCGVKG